MPNEPELSLPLTMPSYNFINQECKDDHYVISIPIRNGNYLLLDKISFYPLSLSQFNLPSICQKYSSH